MRLLQGVGMGKIWTMLNESRYLWAIRVRCAGDSQMFGWSGGNFAWIQVSIALPKLYRVLLDQGWQMFSMNGQIDSTYFRLCRAHDLCQNYSTLLLGCESSHRKYLNKWVWLCSNKTIFMDTEIWISCHFYASKIVFFRFFPTI